MQRKLMVVGSNAVGVDVVEPDDIDPVTLNVAYDDSAVGVADDLQNLVGILVTLEEIGQVQLVLAKVEVADLVRCAVEHVLLQPDERVLAIAAGEVVEAAIAAEPVVTRAADKSIVAVIAHEMVAEVV